MSVNATVIASEAPHVYRALLQPNELMAWWGCTVVTDARAGGLWVAGWGEGAGALGHATVLSAQISRLEVDRLIALKIGDTEISMNIDAAAHGTTVRLEHQGGDAATAEANLASWGAAIESLKAWVEQAHPFVPPPQPEAAPPPPAPVAAPAPASEPPGEIQGAHGADPYAIAGVATAKVVDEGGFGVTDPNAVIKSWSKEQGFGYVTHAQLGDVVFDYDGCDFEPVPGDKVLLLVIGKRYDGKPKIKRIACPAKGSNIA